MKFDKETLEKMYKGGNLPWDSYKPYEELVDFVSEIKPCRALDIGCGAGSDAIFLAEKGFDVSGIDISEEAIKIAKDKAEKAGVKVDFRVGDAFNLPFESGVFEFVNDNGFFHLLENDDERKEYLKKIIKIMKPKAKYFMKCFSDKEPEDPRLPQRLSEETIRNSFSDYFNILHIKDAPIKDHKGYFVLMERK